MNELILAALANIGRSFIGWLENSLADKKIQPVEWARLAKTTVKITSYTVIVYFGLETAGFDPNAISVALGGIAFDIVESRLSNIVKA